MIVFNYITLHHISDKNELTLLNALSGSAEVPGKKDKYSSSLETGSGLFRTLATWPIQTNMHKVYDLHTNQ